ncbi:RNA polymerase sigma factor [Planctomicrobium sp. SH527]|uniref:RNA polymerase sigma factor n=1 Tax=Planctomicrobium sp. SH527 TaxID=3448123 RepID=UPI003F5CA823
MAQSKSADEELAAWVSKSAPQVLGYALTLVRHKDVAEDLVQDCYRRLLAKAKDYNLRDDGTKLLYRAITNACINWTRRQHHEVSLNQLPQATQAKGHPLADPSAAEPIQLAMKQELEAAIEACMERLPVEQRATLELRALGHSLVDIADMLNISHGNARVLLHRARGSLAEWLRPYLEEDTK